MRPIRLSDACRFRPEAFLPERLYGSAGTRVFLLCLEPGQGLPARADAEELVCYLVEGRVTLTIGGDTAVLSAGDLAAAAPGEVRGVEAEERSVVLWIHVSPGKTHG